MANNNSPFGFVPVKTMGGEGAPAMNEYSILTAYATGIGLGDPVKFAGDSSTFGKPYLALAGVSDVFVGIFAGCEYTDSSGAVRFEKNWVASTSVLTGTRIKAYVYDDPRTLFKVQMSGALAATDIPNNADLTAGTVVNGVSGAMLDSTTILTTNTLGWRIREFWEAPGNELGTYGIVVCQINRSAFSNQIATGS